MLSHPDANDITLLSPQYLNLSTELISEPLHCHVLQELHGHLSAIHGPTEHLSVHTCALGAGKANAVLRHFPANGQIGGSTRGNNLRLAVTEVLQDVLCM